MIRLYAPGLPDDLVLPESESGHAIRVMRLREGDAIEAVDGRGNLFRCEIVDAHPKRAMVRVDEIVPQQKTWDEITLAIAPTKHNDRMEWLVEKLVEMGIDRIVPLRCHRSERKDINVERLEKIAVAAMKQSLKAHLPIIDATTPFDKFIADCGAEQKFIAYCDPEIERKLMAKEYKPSKATAILIGPEGDFDPSEIRAALDGGWMPVSLGDSRLRTETAALFAVAACHVLSQKMS